MCEGFLGVGAWSWFEGFPDRCTGERRESIRKKLGNGDDFCVAHLFTGFDRLIGLIQVRGSQEAKCCENDEGGEQRSVLLILFVCFFRLLRSIPSVAAVFGLCFYDPGVLGS